MHLKNKAYAITIILMFLIPPCLADDISGVSIQSFSSELADNGRYATNIINGSGLDSGSHSNSAVDMWQAVSGDLTPSIVIDLSGLCEIQSLSIWNYNASDASYSTWFGVKNIEVYGCCDRLISDDSTWELLVSTVLTKASYPANSDYSNPDVIDIIPAEVTHIKLLAKTNYITDLGWPGSQWQQGNMSGLSEIKIQGIRKDYYSDINGVTVLDYSDESLEWGFRAAENTVNGSGFENGTHCLGWEFSWQAGPENGPHYIIWDLGFNSIVEEIQVWNLNATLKDAWMAAKDIDVYISDDNINYVLLKSVTLSYPPNSDRYNQPDLIDCFRKEARYIKFVINNNYGGLNSDYAGLSEVRFKGYCFPRPSCSETGVSNLEFDFSGPEGIPDCYVNLYDLAYFLFSWE